MGVFYSFDLEHMRLAELRFVVEREYLGESVGQFLARGREPLEFARFLFGIGNARVSPDAGLMQFPEVGITDAESLADAIERVTRWSSLTFRAAWPELTGRVADAWGNTVETISLGGGHGSELEWRTGVEGDLSQAGFIRCAPWEDSGTKVVPIEPAGHAPRGADPDGSQRPQVLPDEAD